MFHPTIIDIPIGTRVTSVEVLNQLLANMSDLYSQIKTAHWNIKGMFFYSLHKLFDDLATGVQDHIDSVGERITALGGTAYGTLRKAVSNSLLEELDIETNSPENYISSLSRGIVIITTSLRVNSKLLDELGDITTANYLLELAFSLDKYLYFLESHLQ